jgi:methylated-DNA-[protein]-cysteine S-methyltransferase
VVARLGKALDEKIVGACSREKALSSAARTRNTRRWHGAHVVMLQTPIGPIGVVVDNDVVVAIEFDRTTSSDHPLAREALAQLRAYFDNKLRNFDLPLGAPGTAFQRRVWSALTQIPFGVTTTYGALAKDLGVVSARAVGTANGSNPIAIVVPCHRVIGGDGALTGYGGGLHRKEWLLRHERALLI